MARFTKRIGKRVLSGILYDDIGYVLTCAAYPDIAAKYAGVRDATPAIEEFERRATAGTEPAARATTEAK